MVFGIWFTCSDVTGSGIGLNWHTPGNSTFAGHLSSYPVFLLVWKKETKKRSDRFSFGITDIDCDAGCDAGEPCHIRYSHTNWFLYAAHDSARTVFEKNTTSHRTIVQLHTVSSHQECQSGVSWFWRLSTACPAGLLVSESAHYIFRVSDVGLLFHRLFFTVPMDIFICHRIFYELFSETEKFAVSSAAMQNKTIGVARSAFFRNIHRSSAADLSGSDSVFLTIG